VLAPHSLSCRERLSRTAYHQRTRRSGPRSAAVHKDPFDRILIAQASVERITLLTTDRKVAEYPGTIRKV